MVKRKDEFADPSLDITTTAPASAKTGRTLEDLAVAGATPTTEATWTRARATWVPPMLAELAATPPERPAESDLPAEVRRVARRRRPQR